MIYGFTRYDFGLPVDISFNSLTGKKLFNRDLKIVWLMKGSISLKTNLFSLDKKNNRVYLNENDIFLINSYSEYEAAKVSEEQEEEINYMVLSIKYTFCRDIISEFKKKLYHITYNSRNNEKLAVIRKILAEIFDIYLNNDFNLMYILKKKLKDLLQKINGNFCINNNRKDDLLIKYSNNIIFKIILEMEENYDKNISLKYLADKYHYNPSYLSNKFKKILMMNFKEYLNLMRLERAVELLLYTRENINQISLATGFGNLKSFYRTFNSYFDYNPAEYRKNFSEIKSKQLKEKLSETLIEKFDHYIKIFKSEGIDKKNAEEKVINISGKEKIFQLKKVWGKLINIGAANSILNSNLRKQLKEMQQDIGFEYLRFEGIFNDNLEICKGDSIRNINYNWKFVDEILDFLSEINIKPFISLSYMPDVLASKDKTMFYYHANYSPPKKMEAWLDLVYSFIIHIINRFDIEEVSKWYFQVWTEFPFHGMHWAGTDEEYFNFYAKTVLKIKEISPELKVGPASENFHMKFTKSEAFLRYCKENNLSLDFYNMNLYHNSISLSSTDINRKRYYSESNLNKFKFEFKEKDYGLQESRKMKALINKYYPDLELIVSRWNFSWHVKEYVHDTVFMANFISDNVLKLQNIVDGIGYLTLSDILTEWPIDESPFFGGRGLINTEGIKKASYFVFMFLSRLGEEIVKHGDYYIITRDGSDLKVLFYNYAYLNKSYQNGDQSLIDEENRYSVFENKKNINVTLNINNLAGKYKITHYLLSRETGSAFDEWIKMGSVYQLNNEEIKYLKHKSYPQMKVNYVKIKDYLELTIQLRVHEVKFISIEKIYEN